jgi:hypothetical protein
VLIRVRDGGEPLGKGVQGHAGQRTHALGATKRSPYTASG